LSLTVRRLGEADVQIYRDIRLEGLRTEPSAFGSTEAEEATLTDDDNRARLAKAPTFGAFDGSAMVGTAAYSIEVGEKTKHRAHLVGVYVREDARGTGAGRMLLDTVIESARQDVTFLYLQVTQDNARAVRFYERAGFTIYGRDPGGLFVDGTMYQDYLMMLRLH
jgi:ribosomal protein S18 acetylase RimI-like enzyme